MCAHMYREKTSVYVTAIESLKLQVLWELQKVDQKAVFLCSFWTVLCKRSIDLLPEAFPYPPQISFSSVPSELWMFPQCTALCAPSVPAQVGLLMAWFACQAYAGASFAHPHRIADLLPLCLCHLPPGERVSFGPPTLPAFLPLPRTPGAAGKDFGLLH